MVQLPSVHLSFQDGLKPNLAYLFANDKAEVPISVSISSAGAVIEEVGLYNACKYATSLNPDDFTSGDLDSRLSITQVPDASSREFEAHPENTAQPVAHVAGSDDTRTFLVRTKDNGGLKGDKARKDMILLGAYVKLSGYVSGPGAKPTEGIIFSYIDAAGASKIPIINRNRISLVLLHKPELGVFLKKSPLSQWGSSGSDLVCGEIFSIRPSYGVYEGKHAPTIKDVETKLLEKCPKSGKFIEKVTGKKPFHMSPDDEENGVDTFYCDSPTGHPDVILRAVFHGTKQRGMIVQKIGSEAAHYKYDKEAGWASFSWYYLRSSKLPVDEVKKLQDVKVEDGKFVASITDAYGSKASVSVGCSTAYSGTQPVNISFSSESCA